MTTKPKLTNGAHAGAPESVVEKTNESITTIARHLVEKAIDLTGEITPEAQIQMDLRSSDHRSKILEDLLVEICPNGINERVWSKWLNGGESPFPKENEGKLDKVGVANERPVQTLTRSSKRVKTQENKIANLRAQIADEERHLVYLKAHQNAAVHWQVADQLIRLISATFAMGPAWALMRVVSPFASQAEVEFETRYMFEDEVREEGERRFREQRKTESAELLEALDFFKGDMRFERDLRKKIKEVVEDHESRRPALKAQGRRSRSKDAMRNSIAPHGRADMEEILASFCWAD